MAPASRDSFQLWYFHPSMPGAIIMAVVFTILTITHLTLIVQNGKKFMIPILVGGIFEIIGYIFRAIAHNNETSVLVYSVQSLLILLAPILFAASTYMYLHRIIDLMQPLTASSAGTPTFAVASTLASSSRSLSPISPRYLTKIFVTGDVICFLVQGGGGGILASSKSDSSFATGQNVILGGLILQILLFLCFLGIAGVVHARGKKSYTKGLMASSDWQGKMLGLYVVSALILVRNLIRVIEYGVGSDGYLLRHEWTIFVFDGVLMLAVLGVSILWYNRGLKGLWTRRGGEPVDTLSMGRKTRDDESSLVV